MLFYTLFLTYFDPLFGHSRGWHALYKNIVGMPSHKGCLRHPLMCVKALHSLGCGNVEECRGMWECPKVFP